MSLIKTTPRLLEAAQIINDVDAALLTKIAKRVCREWRIPRTFSTEESDQLKDALSLDQKKLELLLSTLSYVIQQAAFHIMKPATFSEQLKVIGFNDSTSAIIADLWAVHAKHIIETKRKESVVPLKVDNVESSLHIHLSSHTGGQVKIPLGLLHLDVSSGADESKSTLSLEFTRSEMLSFFQTLEEIQCQLDQIM